MTTTIRPVQMLPGPRRRHHSRVQQFSRDPDLLDHLDSLVVSDYEARSVIAAACGRLDVVTPALKFHARRSTYTGATEQPRFVWVRDLGESEVIRREILGWGSPPPNGAIRLGRTTTLMTIAHELGHHLVFCLDPPRTPPHGKQWVSRFDEAASVLSAIVELD